MQKFLLSHTTATLKNSQVHLNWYQSTQFCCVKHTSKHKTKYCCLEGGAGEGGGEGDHLIKSCFLSISHKIKIV